MTAPTKLLAIDLARYQHAIIDAVHRAGERLTAMQPHIHATQDLTIKSDGTIVTEADLTSDDILRTSIYAVAPSHPHIVSEEAPTIAPRHLRQPIWYVDPLDGTRAYAAGSTDFAIHVSEWSAGEPRFSVAYYPALEELAVAVGQQAAWTSPTARLTEHVEAARPPVLHTCYVRSRSYDEIATNAHATYSGEQVESTRALLDLATGAAIATVVFLCGHRSWDVAPLLHLIAANGGQVSDENGDAIRLSGSQVSGRYIIAANDHALHQELVDETYRRATSELPEEATET